jgi:hypothetical protein
VNVSERVIDSDSVVIARIDKECRCKCSALGTHLQAVGRGGVLLALNRWSERVA